MSTSFTSDALIGVVGAGAMGAGIAEVAATGGHPVRVVDLGEEALKRGKDLLAASLASRVRRGSLTDTEAREISGRIVWSRALESLVDARLVIEAIIERKEAKLELFAALETVLEPQAALATNTSSLAIRELAEELVHPERFIGLHFFNPAPAMRLVEVVAGPSTDEGLVWDMLELMTRWRKTPVTVADVPGFIVNRIARPYYAEGFLALEEGIPAADIDLAVRQNGGFRMGPLELADLIGHDVNYGVAESIYAAYGGETRFRPQPAQKALVDGGHLGKKSGQGVYRSGESQAASLITEAADPIEIAHNLLKHGAGLRQALERLDPPARMDPALPEESIRLDGMLLALGDGRSAAQRSRGDGTAVLLDIPRLWEASALLVASFAPAAPPDAAAKIAGLAKRLGREALIMPDRPGGLVLRTLAQLANAAADASHDGIANAADIDAALMFGANHPEGPLSWSNRVGPDFVRKVLDNIARETGDSLYLPSAGLVG